MSLNIPQHELVHLRPSIECYGCPRKFTTYSGMVIHLETGNCDSGVDIIDINESAAMCYQWRSYLDEDYRDEMLQCVDLKEEYAGTVYPFECAQCEASFPKLSALFQHVESSSCEQDLDGKAMLKLMTWLKKRHA